MEDDVASTMHSNSWVNPDAPAPESALEKFKAEVLKQMEALADTYGGPIHT